jgi:hypothetical protein
MKELYYFWVLIINMSLIVIVILDWLVWLYQFTNVNSSGVCKFLQKFSEVIQVIS